MDAGRVWFALAGTPSNGQSLPSALPRSRSSFAVKSELENLSANLPPVPELIYRIAVGHGGFDRNMSRQSRLQGTGSSGSKDLHDEATMIRSGRVQIDLGFIRMELDEKDGEAAGTKSRFPPV